MSVSRQGEILAGVTSEATSGKGTARAGRGSARVVVVGGGFGGLETAFDLRLLAGDRAEITLVSDQDHFLFKPNSIYVPFGLDPDRLQVPHARRGDPGARRARDQYLDARRHASLAGHLREPRGCGQTRRAQASPVRGSA